VNGDRALRGQLPQRVAMHPKVRGCVVGIHPLADASVLSRGSSRQQTIGYQVCEATQQELE
jgi:hypothetical protein